MAKVELIMPKMGESIVEATILKWLKQVGDTVELDEPILEIATDKVDSEVPSPVEGTITEILFNEEDVVSIGKAIAVISTEGEEATTAPSPAVIETTKEEVATPAPAQVSTPTPATGGTAVSAKSAGRFYSPLVRNIAAQEHVSQQELDAIPGTGLNNRVTKQDLLNYLKTGRKSGSNGIATGKSSGTIAAATTMPSGQTEIMEMDRMRKLISKHMVQSWHTSPHVTSFVEADVTEIVQWRNKHKVAFQERYGEKITFTPIFMEAVVKAIKDFPMVNVSVNGEQIIIKKDINLGMAAALPSGNLIVPVIKQADHLNLVGLTKQVNDLAGRARSNKLKPEEIQDGTFTVTNVGTFGNIMGTPIINQPQVAILALGAIKKKPAVVETRYGDLIAVRHLMFLSLSYDHRVVDGALGGSLLRRIADYLESFDGQMGI